VITFGCVGFAVIWFYAGEDQLNLRVFALLWIQEIDGFGGKASLLAVFSLQITAKTAAAPGAPPPVWILID